MSVAIPPAPPIPGVLPQPFVTNDGRLHSVNESTFHAGTLLKGAGIGAAVGGVLGGVALLGKIAIPLLGKVASLGGLLRFGLIGGAIGLAVAGVAMVVHASSLRRNEIPHVPGYAGSGDWVPVGVV
ncbi:MAG: hypothetical protein ABI200_02455 [Gaiellales bacterium]